MNRLAAADRVAWVAAALAALASAAGIFIGDVYRDAPYWVQQARGTDVATLLLAVPVLGIGLWAAGRGSSAGRAAVVGALLYLIYNYAIFAFSVAMNPLSAVYIATFGLAVWSAALSLTAPERVPPLVDLPRRLAAAVLIVVAILFGLLWLSQIADATFSGNAPVDLQRAGLPTNPVYALDLGLFLPLCAVAAVGLMRRVAPAAAFALPMLLWLSITSAGIVAGFWFTLQAGDEVPLPIIAVVGTIGVITGLLAASAVRRR